jgi:hypothetical protein
MYHLSTFFQTIPPGIIPQLKKNAGHGIEGAKKLLEVLTEIKKKGGIKTLEAALEFVENNRVSQDPGFAFIAKAFRRSLFPEFFLYP